MLPHYRPDNRGEGIMYRTEDGRTALDVRLAGETVWLTQAQIAGLFDTKRPAITKHLANTFKNKELYRRAVCSILEHTAADGKRYKTQYYNLDAIVSVGYRVNSSRATRFRIWATHTLKDHLIRGYTLNERRLREKGITEAEQAIQLLSRTLTQHPRAAHRRERAAQQGADDWAGYQFAGRKVAMKRQMRKDR